MPSPTPSARSTGIEVSCRHAQRSQPAQLLAPAAQLIALIKPTFELHAAALAGQPQQVAAAVNAAARALEDHGWRLLGHQQSPILGSKGAVEVLVHATSW